MRKTERGMYRIMIRGGKIQLRPVKQSDFEQLYAKDQATFRENGFNNLSVRNGEYLEHRFGENGMLTAEYGMFVVETLDGQFVGDVSYHKEHYGPGGHSYAYNIGIELSFEQRGKGYGVEAQRLLAAYLFKMYPVMRVEASTDIENKAEQRALEKAGFTREGVLRKVQWRDGAWHDLVVYGKLRGE